MTGDKDSTGNGAGEGIEINPIDIVPGKAFEIISIGCTMATVDGSLIELRVGTIIKALNKTVYRIVHNISWPSFKIKATMPDGNVIYGMYFVNYTSPFSRFLKEIDDPDFDDSGRVKCHICSLIPLPELAYKVKGGIVCNECMHKHTEYDYDKKVEMLIIQELKVNKEAFNKDGEYIFSTVHEHANHFVEEYKGIEIHLKRDFLPEQRVRGYVGVKGSCNVMPGAVWYKSITQIKEGIDTFLQAGGLTEHYDNKYFWDLTHKEYAKYEISDGCGKMVYRDSLGHIKEDITTAVQKNVHHTKHLGEHKCKGKVA